MTKLSKSVSDKNENKSTSSVSNTSLTFTKKTNVKDENKDTTEESTTINKQVKSKVINTNINSPEDVAKWLIELIGEDLFNQIKSNPHLQLPYTEENISSTEWLVKALKTIFASETLDELTSRIKEFNSDSGQASTELEQIEKEKQALVEKWDKAQARFSQLQAEVDNAETEKFQLEKQLSTSIELNSLLDEIFEENRPYSDTVEKLVKLFKDAIQNFDKNLSSFLIKFAKGWAAIQAATALFGKDEKENMEIAHKATIYLLKSISGTFVSERRPALDLVADFISELFTEYEFVSAEQTLQVDPDIHNAHGKGATHIKEGISFAVIRKESRKAVIYADIKV